METKAWQGVKGKVDLRTVKLLKEVLYFIIFLYFAEDSFLFPP